MDWKISIAEAVQEKLKQLPKEDYARIFSFLRDVLAADDPRAYGCAVSSSWHYFIDEFAVVAQIDDAAKKVHLGLLYRVALEEANEGKSHTFFLVDALPLNRV
jgi:mRNA-degrading endonuclease RelE of RelBE toxin-antitoxin system